MSHVVWPQRVLVLAVMWWRSRAQSEEPPPPHHRVISGKSCQDHHSPEVQAKVKIKSWVKSAARWPHPTGHAVGYEGL